MDKLQMQQSLAGKLCESVAQMLVVAHPRFEGGGERLTLDASVAMIGITAATVALSNFGVSDEDHPEIRAVPTHDHILFTCLYISNSVLFRRDGTLEVEYDTVNVIKTLEQFEDITGRSFEPLLDHSLMEKVQEIRDEAKTNTQFTPN